MSDTSRGATNRSGFDFFEAGELPTPQITAAEAEQLVAEQFGRTVVARSLGSQQDANFLLTDADGATVGVLKVSNGAFGEAEIRAQDEGAAQIAERLPHLRVPTVLEHATAGRPARVLRPGGSGEVARILSFLDGGTLTGSGYLRPPVVEGLGALSGMVNRELRDFEHEGVHRTLQWDLREAARVIDQLAHYVDDVDRRRVVEEVRRVEGARIEALAARLPVSVIHGDITDDNVVRSADEHGTPDGVIDFGDLNMGWSVAELAVTVSSILHHEGATPVSTLPAIRAFHRERPLTGDEVQALWPLVLLRGAVVVVSGWQQAAIDADNEYARDALEHEWRILENALTVPTTVMTALVQSVVGAPASPLALPASFPPMLDGQARVATLDLSVDSDAMDEGAWLLDGREAALARDRLAAGADAVSTVHLQPRLTRSVRLSREEPATAATGIDVWFGRDTDVRAPWAGRVEVEGGDVSVIDSDHGIVLRLNAESAEVVASGTVGPGDPVLTVKAGSRLRITVAAAEAAVPDFVRASEIAGWRAVVADPLPLLVGTSDPVKGADRNPNDADELVHRREQHFASVQEHYYRHPPRIERGWQHTMIDVDARCYLDMVNNVTSLGHAHPGVERAAARQLRRLNTNSRFNYGAVVEYSTRLSELLPALLDTVFLVNSGSEAVDLALRIALATTGRPDVLAVAEAYHGWTFASDAVSTSIADNPNALETRPDWVHTVDAPNAYRGRYRGPDVGRYADDAVETIHRLAAEGRPPAAFIAEAYYGNAGGMALPDGYLDKVYAAVREHGGLAIADEVQVGYGRLGEWFWGFEQQGVVPDIVTVAKAIGNGHPLGAVITSREVAERYRNQGYFFSSAGGSPVSSAVGLAVLDALRDEKLQQNARDVGRHLKERLTQLAERHELIGAVHGSGLYLGVELVRDRETREPATRETTAICERMLELGVIIQPTGDRQCVLKTKPPLCLDRESADYFVDALDHVLSTGY
ncbi:aminotransferase [Pseudolysinimonas yzui]|uniref:4-aminobutyrate aminotransferase n=1 Tax=Pseudolysinimonas yzui TaxID=2708254 RepID=A0A8J3DVF1_9MICO|nr:aminotransferase [Pseudolysinimonas yzui]GHF03797.1 4-aminobutyrate aminotransferase [Pseudolysinimonas yzui]